MKKTILAFSMLFSAHAVAGPFFHCGPFEVKEVSRGKYLSGSFDLHGNGENAEAKLVAIKKGATCVLTVEDKTGKREFTYDFSSYTLTRTDDAEIAEDYRRCRIHYPARSKFEKCNLAAAELSTNTGDGVSTCYYAGAPVLADPKKAKFTIKENKATKVCVVPTMCEFFGRTPHHGQTAKEGFSWVVCLPDKTGKCTKDYKVCRDDNDLAPTPEYSEGNIHYYLNMDPEAMQ